jgi:hypothetical protein
MNNAIRASALLHILARRLMVQVFHKYPFAERLLNHMDYLIFYPEVIKSRKQGATFGFMISSLRCI